MYRHWDDDESLMTIPNLEDPQNEWEVKEVLDQHKIKNIVHYLVKWIDWLSKYNSYELASHLVNMSHVVAAFEQKLKQK